MHKISLRFVVNIIVVLCLASATYVSTQVSVYAGKPVVEFSGQHSVYAPGLAEAGVLSSKQFADIELTDQDGQSFSFDQFTADATIVNFMFSGCAVECPRQTAQLREITRRLSSKLNDKTVKILSITITPEADSSRTLKSFASRFDIDSPHWRFVRASRKDTDELMTQFAVSSNTDISNPLDHRNVIYLFNSDGVLVQQYAADPINTERVGKEVLQLALIND